MSASREVGASPAAVPRAGRSHKTAGAVRTGLVVGLAAGALLVVGCATTTPAGGAAAADAAGGVQPAHPADPWEAWNRKVYAFNDAIDRAVLRPVAETYAKVVPSPARQAVGNFFGNFGDMWSIVNNLLQGKLEGAFVSLARVGTNTVFGLGGLIDIAGESGLERRSEDLGQTLGTWGVAGGPYVVLPLFGPSTLRDTFTFVPDRYVSPNLVVERTASQVALSFTNVVNTRAEILPATRMLDSIALDPYVFVRDAYLQRRLNQVYDGNPPEPAEEPAPAARPPAPAASAPGQPNPPPAR